ncbi:potassium channel family protein [Hymenobacter sp. BT770]|uniref:potassium channel family protein n=1 Tax=Hymenobacter sp. BT770 TaxID=2886942 RepID=UPI001D100166|nr:potassium channel family protein [Hymenobacter sp. BT770]MCC3155238.1 potassium channel family protein [Hymenobacter sp. BT770]MDO3417193.1 potassium channel family protein [Hymenobacter sp. BT770]
MSNPTQTELSGKLERWQNQVREPALSVLLVGQVVVLFVAGPLLSAHVLNFAAMDSLQLLLLLISFFALPLRSRARALILVCLLPIMWMLYAGPDPRLGILLHTGATLGITVAVAQVVFRARRISRHQLLGAVVVYLNLALLFVGAYDAVNWAFPGAFSNGTKLPLQSGELVYFSLTTLTSTGYGDILPVHPAARSLANLEAVIGQLFLAILLARLVSQHSAKENHRP